MYFGCAEVMPLLFCLYPLTNRELLFAYPLAFSQIHRTQYNLPDIYLEVEVVPPDGGWMEKKD